MILRQSGKTRSRYATPGNKLSLEMSPITRGQQQKSQSPKAGNVPATGTCEEAGCPCEVLGGFCSIESFEMNWNVSLSFQSLWFSISCLWLAGLPGTQPTPFQPRNIARLSRISQSTRVILSSRELSGTFTHLSFQPGRYSKVWVWLTFIRCHTRTSQLLSRTFCAL